MRNSQTTTALPAPPRTWASGLLPNAVRRGGSFAQVGAPLERHHAPRNVFRAGFSGSPKMNVLTATRVEGRVDASALLPNQPVPVGLRPEHAALRTARHPIVREGGATSLYPDSGVPDDPLIVQAPGEVHARSGQRFALRPAAVLLLPVAA